MSTLCKCSTCCYFKTAVTKFALHHTEAKLAGWCNGETHCYQCGQSGFKGRCEKCISPPAIFEHVFNEYSFSIISNLLNNNKPYALSMRNHECMKKMHHIGETLRFQGKKFKEASILLKNGYVTTIFQLQ